MVFFFVVFFMRVRVCVCVFDSLIYLMCRHIDSPAHSLFCSVLHNSFSERGPAPRPETDTVSLL